MYLILPAGRQVDGGERSWWIRLQWFELRSEVGVGDEGMALKFFDGALKEGTSGSETGEGSRRTREGDGGASREESQSRCGRMFGR